MKHFLIIGGGIAGASMAYHLLQRNCKVTLVDKGENHSTRVAAGQINPMVFRRMTKSWRVDDLLPYARSWYTEMEQFTDQKIIADKPIRRMFAHEQEKDLWLKKGAIEEFQGYLAPLTEEDLSFDIARNICGSGRVKQSFYVMSKPFLSATTKYISEHENGTWITETIDFADLDPSNSTWKGETYAGIIFCTGYLNVENPFFDFLQIDQTKGEILNVRGPIFEEESLNRRCFVLPYGQSEFRIGSNYDWHNSDLTPSEKTKTEILANLRTLVDVDVEVVAHVAGIRPTTQDRRPIMGKHPELEHLFIFNGLGAKGFMTAPLLGKEMAEYILDEAPLHEEVDIRRYL